MAQDAIGTGGHYLSLLNGLGVLYGDADLNISLEALDEEVKRFLKSHAGYLDSQIVERLGIVADAPPMS
jgi:hypothetical protein